MHDAPPLVLVGVTGGVAAYKTCELVRRLVEAGRDVRCALTPDAARFIGPPLLSALTRKPVLDDRPVLDGSYPHLDAARDAAVVCIAPCTANTLAKLAWGLADNVVTQSALSTPAPLLVAPAMNVRMWRHPATQANVARLRERGVAFVGPNEGALAEGEQGLGRMAEPSEIAAAVEALLARASGALAGRHVLVTAGGTREPLDGVRYLGNRSSGRMGAALAAEASARGADVVTLLANGLVRPESGVVVEVETTEELEHEALARADWADIVLMAAAVADYRPAARESGKRERSGAWSLELEATADVLAALAARRRPGQVLVGFAAEDGSDVGRAEAKRVRKGVDLIVLNDVSRADIGFDADHNEVALVAADGVEHVARAPKRVIAQAVLDRVERLLAGGAPGPTIGP
jgi:phosphopantothenoylcysteine decarboxylase / phosphopantothenate---cysteine ligase